MSFNLWKYFLEDDVDGFCQYLARATYVHGSSKVATASSAGSSFKIGSPGNLATSPKTPNKPRKAVGYAPHSGSHRGAGHVITRADINARDGFGRTILHHAASSRSANATGFVKALLEVPTVDLYIQDNENGWTALHRALYAGNIDIAQALLTRDILNATDFASQSRTQVGGLVKIKDHEGNSPFEVFGMTIAPRDILNVSHNAGQERGNDDEDDANSVDVGDDQEGDRNPRQTRPHTDLRGDEAHAFGSNKNLSLGLGDEDDRQFPERIQLERPEHLLWRLYEDHKSQRVQGSIPDDLLSSVASLHQSEELPAIIRHKAIKIQDIVMAKLHSAILTDDPVSNLHICGFGPGGRLGTGDEITRFEYVCIQGGGLASRRVLSIALGQDHCVAICSFGEVFTWGSNKHGQLGYVLPEVSTKETPMQLVPRQLYGLVKKETIIGAAASSIHSVIYTATGLYTFGKNEGQLGLVDADARSLQIQDIPRRVGVSLVQSQIKAVSAIDRATTVLLENRDVIVFTHYGFTKVSFPLEDSNIFLSQALPTRYSKEANTICKITGGGNTIGALSTFGQVFTVDVPKSQDSIPSNVSTTNPNKARNALPAPNKVWTIKKAHMSAIDVAIGQDGSIIICTEAGAVWKKEKRANIKSVHTRGLDTTRPKDFKFVRVPYITRAIAVRSNAYGAFTAVRRDCEATRDQIYVGTPTLLEDLFPLLSFHKYGVPNSVEEDENAPNPQLRFWRPLNLRPSTASIKAAIMKTSSAEEDFIRLSKRIGPLSETQYDMWITSNVTEVRLPVHSVVLKSRSRVLRSCLTEFQQKYYFSIPDVLSIEYGQEGQIEMKLLGADFLTLVNLVLYLYTEDVLDVWHYTSRALHLAPRYRQIRVELMKIASHLELRRLERAVRVMVAPTSCILDDLENAYMDLDFYSNADVMVDLAAGSQRPAHSIILSSRCPFFEGLFYGHAAGMWLSSRKNMSDGIPEPIHVDLKHVEVEIFDMVLRHIYCDTGDEIFDNIVSKDLDDFIDTVIEVMSVANELMLDRLVQICQSVIGKFVTPRNICGLLNAVAESSIDEFKNAALEYICLNMEGLLEQRFLTDLDRELLEELDEVVQDNQLAFMPFVRSDRARDELLEKHPDLVEQLEISRQRRIDSMKLQTKHVEEDYRPQSKIRVGSYDKLGSSPVSTRKLGKQIAEETSPRASPALTPNEMGEELPFSMDEDGTIPLRMGPGNIKTLSLQPPESNVSGSPANNHRDLLNGEVEAKRAGFDQLHRPVQNSPHVPESRISGFELPKAVWKSSSLQDGPTGLKEIMEQASLSRVSTLTQAMKAAETSTSPAQKMSQRERKRQQQQQQQQQLQQQRESTQIDGTAILTDGAGIPQSPWARVAPARKTNLGSSTPEPGATSNAPRIPQRPSMPNRQTQVGSINPEKEAQAKQKRSTSSNITPHAASSPTPQIQSIRHTPLPGRSASFVDAHTSMADILAQQRREKTAIREAAAKRSLQDIQQEQEFQEWWEEESKKVQEEAARASTIPAARADKGIRGRGRHRKTPGQSGTSSSKPKARDQAGQLQQAQAVFSSSNPVRPSEGEGRGRGLGRGRGRGKPHRDNQPKHDQ